MANTNFIPTGFRQVGDVCLLASYSAVLGYYKNVNAGTADDFDVYSLFRLYIDYVQTLLSAIPSDRISTHALGERLVQLEGCILRELGDQPANPIAIRRLYENYVSIVLHWYCQNVRSSAELRNGIHGYIHIKEFDEYLQSTHNQLCSQNFQIAGYEAQNVPIANAYNIINAHLEAADHNLAMVLYRCGGGCHSIMIARNRDGVIYRDSNATEYSTVSAVTQSFKFNTQSQIQEYILFKLANK